MDTNDSPFNDPEVQEAMRQAGVVHRPGLADEMMAELSPLLAADGIDLDNLGEDMDLDRLNTALRDASERYNMELSTPVGDELTRALATLREISDAIQQDDVEQAERIFDTVGPEVTPRRPSAAQLMGTSLDLLDTWHAQDPTRTPLATLGVPRWLGRGRPVAADLLALARKGRAWATLDRLIGNHGGLVVAHGGAMLLAASLKHLAVHGQESYADLAARYLPGAPPSGTGSAAGSTAAGSGSGSAFGPAAAAAVSSRRVAEEFRRWLAQQPETTPEGIEAEVGAMEAVFSLASTAGIDPHAPEELDEILDLVYDAFQPHQIEAMLDLLHDYVDFRVATEPSSAGWDEAHELISEEFSATDAEEGPPEALLAALREAEGVSDSQRRAALTALPLIEASRRLLDWIGASQPITQAGVPRRADIGAVAGLIGVDAEGTARRPEHTDWTALAEDVGRPVRERHRVQVLSAREVPELVAWWDGLEDAGVIQRLVTRVRPGPNAAALTAGDSFDLEVADELISTYVAAILTSSLDTSASIAPFAGPLVMQSITRVLEAMMPDAVDEGAPSDPLPEMFQIRAQDGLRRLEVAGLVEFTGGEQGRPVVPLAVRAPVMIGAMTASALAQGGEE